MATVTNERQVPVQVRLAKGVRFVLQPGEVRQLRPNAKIVSIYPVKEVDAQGS